jgi:diguanylate cyclase (GGDEF)-like protein
LADEVAREHTFCRLLLDDAKPIVVPDATKDERFKDNPHVTADLGVRFYAGMPLRTDGGHVVGSLCIVDTKPREFGEQQAEVLKDLADMTMDELELRMLATKDSLTGSLSRRAFKEEAAREVALAVRHHHDLSLIVLDLDFFKRINDRFGHAAGDRALIKVVEACRGVLRLTDRIGRLGGEEFAILLPETDQTGAMEVANKVRLAVEHLDFGPDAIKATVSLGVASLDPLTRDLNSLLGNADKALYDAKEQGRNRAVGYQAPAAALPARRRVLKAGQIVFNGGTSSIDCTVRSLSDGGAGIDVSSTVGVPKSFDLAIKADGLKKPARIVAHTERHLEVEFV